MSLDQILRRKAGRIISRPPTTAVSEIVNLMRAENIGAVVIVRIDGSVAGIISEREIVAALNKHGSAAMQLFSRDIMITDLPQVRPDEKIHNVMTMMTLSRMRHVPVVDGRNLVGVLSIGDIVAARLDETNMENAVLRDMALSHLAAA